MKIIFICEIGANDLTSIITIIRGNEGIKKMTNFLWQARVYYEDTDAGGVVYHARYLAFFERARTEMLRQLGVEQHTLLAAHIAFVVRKMNVDYFFPARLDDLLTIETEMKLCKKASLVLQQTIKNQHNTINSQAEVVIACLDLQRMKPTSFPQTFLDKFK